jgi:HDOD domain
MRGMRLAGTASWKVRGIKRRCAPCQFAHQFLLKPCDPEMLHAGIARSTSLGEVLDSKMLTSLVGALRDLPSLPRVFSELKVALAQPKVSIELAKHRQLVNSAFFGLARDVTNVKTAVTCLGISLLHDLVLTLGVFRSFTPNEFVSVDYLEEFHRATLRPHRCRYCEEDAEQSRANTGGAYA